MKKLFGAFAALTIMLLGAQFADAKSSYLTSFTSTYAGTSATALNSCTLCHPSVPSLNSYGNAYAAAGHNFASIAGADSDGDGFTNLVEINARTFPGNAASKPAAPPVTDTTPPTVTGFTIPANSTSLTVAITAFTATDNVKVTRYMVTESSTAPAAAAAGWVLAAPTKYTFTTMGAKTLYAWAKDAAGNVSTSLSAAVTLAPPPPLATDIGKFANGAWKIDTNGDGLYTAGVDLAYTYGQVGSQAVTGRWTNDGVSKIGTFKAGVWRLDLNGDGIYDAATELFRFGKLGDKPVVGDFNGDGIDEIGVYRAGKFIIDQDGNRTLDPAELAAAQPCGLLGGRPVTGNFLGTGDRLGLFKAGKWYIDSNGDGVFDIATEPVYTFGVAGDIPVVGDWDGDGTDDIGIYRPLARKWMLDWDGNHVLDKLVDRIFVFAAAQPVAAK